MKYRVCIEDWTRYYFDVEADTEEEAEEKAMQEWEDGDHDFSDSSVEAVSVEKLEENV